MCEQQQLVATFCAYTSKEAKILNEARDVRAALAEYRNHLRNRAKHVDADQSNHDTYEQFLAHFAEFLDV